MKKLIIGLFALILGLGGSAKAASPAGIYSVKIPGTFTTPAETSTFDFREDNSLMYYVVAEPLYINGRLVLPGSTTERRFIWKSRLLSKEIYVRPEQGDFWEAPWFRTDGEDLIFVGPVAALKLKRLIHQKR